VTLGAALVLTAAVTLLRPWLLAHRRLDLSARAELLGTVAGGAFVGALVTLSSVGAGAMGAAFLLLLYPSLPVAAVVGTDLAHAVFLAALAGIGHWRLGAVDVALLAPLLMGSIPGLYLGTRWAGSIRDALLRPAIATLLLMLGLGFTLPQLI
ncbi:MAG TPA: sulfite exporter TauE/SafE family protein, partial [Arenicellales bacterium]|nr:sulfite exporter TauE/SafE family protein [Arenicellales bacterium]